MTKYLSCCHFLLSTTQTRLIWSINIYLAPCYMTGFRNRAKKKKESHSGFSRGRTVVIILSMEGFSIFNVQTNA